LDCELAEEFSGFVGLLYYLLLKGKISGVSLTMKITKTELKQIIKEEIAKVMYEYDPMLGGRENKPVRKEAEMIKLSGLNNQTYGALKNKNDGKHPVFKAPGIERYFRLRNFHAYDKENDRMNFAGIALDYATVADMSTSGIVRSISLRGASDEERNALNDVGSWMADVLSKEFDELELVQSK